MASSMIQNQNKTWRPLSNDITANGNYPMLASLSNVTEIMIQLYYAGKIRYSVILTKYQLVAGYCFPDVTISNERMYASISVEGSNIVVSSFSKPSSWSSGAFVVLYR